MTLLFRSLLLPVLLLSGAGASAGNEVLHLEPGQTLSTGDSIVTITGDRAPHVTGIVRTKYQATVMNTGDLQMFVAYSGVAVPPDDDTDGVWGPWTLSVPIVPVASAHGTWGVSCLPVPHPEYKFRLTNADGLLAMDYQKPDGTWVSLWKYTLRNGKTLLVNASGALGS